MRKWWLGGLVGVVLVATPLIVHAAPQAERRPSPDSLSGRDTYEFYCAGCHGAGGKGDGPVASSLKTRVPDLTTLAARSGGAFPRARVRAAVSNTERPVAAHTTGDMPVWGTIFQIRGASRAQVETRIDNVVDYLASMQAPPRASVVDTGRQLFQANCVRCHGPNAGGGLVGGGVRPSAPDLTMFAIQNGGVFPSERVRRIIDGRDVAAHVMRDMPVWGEVFRTKAGGATPAQVAARIEALTAYLESIQARRGE